MGLQHAIRRRLALLLGVVTMPALLASMRLTPRTASMRSAPRTVWDSVYTADQAVRGQASYNQTCAKCHQQSLGGADEAPPLAGSTFLGGWNGQTLGAMHERIRSSMPPDDPGTFGRQLIADVMAYMLKVNGFPAGAAELPMEAGALKEIRLEATRR